MKGNWWFWEFGVEFSGHPIELNIICVPCKPKDERQAFSFSRLFLSCWPFCTTTWVPPFSHSTCESASVRQSVVSDFLRPHRLWPARLLHPWDSPGKNTGGGCHSLLQGIFLTLGSNLVCRQILYSLRHQGSRSRPVIKGQIFETEEKSPNTICYKF